MRREVPLNLARYRQPSPAGELLFPQQLAQAGAASDWLQIRDTTPPRAKGTKTRLRTSPVCRLWTSPDGGSDRPFPSTPQKQEEDAGTTAHSSRIRNSLAHASTYTYKYTWVLRESGQPASPGLADRQSPTLRIGCRGRRREEEETVWKKQLFTHLATGHQFRDLVAQSRKFLYQVPGSLPHVSVFFCVHHLRLFTNCQIVVAGYRLLV